MGIFSDKDKAARAELREARKELDRISRRDRCESDAYLKANKRVDDLIKKGKK